MRKAFEMASSLYPYDAILGQLNLIEQAAGTDVVWTQQRLYRLLRNETYRGDIQTHKSYCLDYVGKVRVKNRGEHEDYYITDHHELGDRLLQKQAPKNYLTHKPDWLQAYESHYVKDTHEGIVRRELWDAVQSRLERANELTSFGAQCRTDSHFLYGKIFCGVCGHPMKRKTVNATRPREDGTVDKIAVWKCADRLNGSKGNGCKNDILKEDELIEMVCCELDINTAELEEGAERIDRIIVTGGQVEVFTFAAKEA